VSTNGEIVAHYDYSPFGELLVESGEMASAFTHRFSTKPWCPVTGLYEYQMRKYRPEIGRWLSRDAYDEEIGEVNNVVFVSNDSLSQIDYLGNIPIALEKAIKELGYQFWRNAVLKSPHWKMMIDDWYHEAIPSPLMITGSGDPR
jgi:RHS repeat-associated protein